MEYPHSNIGGRYDLATDTWAPIAPSPSDGPRGFQRPVSVWTGEEMIVWGGSPTTNTGGRYNPATDMWTRTSMIGAPSARYGHRAVWTGEEMFVWGGFTEGGDPAGGRYHAPTDTWQRITTVSAPGAIVNMALGWTGSEMLAWGGWPYLENSGGRYDPVTDSWTRMSTIGQPVIREWVSTVWTGSELIVWGGMRFPPPIIEIFNTGGRYDPATDSWAPTSLADAPPPQVTGLAIWTGAEMIVWGPRGSR